MEDEEVGWWQNRRIAEAFGEAVWEGRRRGLWGRRVLHDWSRAWEGAEPGCYETDDLGEILSILTPLARERTSSFCHVLMPTSGGADLTGVRESEFEQGCIEILSGGIADLARPRSFAVRKYEHLHHEWWHCRLETDDLDPVGFSSSSGSEECLRLPDGTLLDRSYYDHGYAGYGPDGEELPIPDGSMIIGRQLEAGRFFSFICKGSMLNFCQPMYLPEYSNMPQAEFDRFVGFYAELISPHFDYDELAFQSLRGECQTLGEDESLLGAIYALAHTTAVSAPFYNDQIRPYALGHLRQQDNARLRRILDGNFQGEERDRLAQELGLD